MQAQCRRCSHPIAAPSAQRLPPWCPKCGTDLEVNRVIGLGDDDPAAPDAAHLEWVARNLKERFTKHNLVVGVVLAVWGLAIGARGQTTHFDKLLSSEPTLATVLTALQWGTLANGGLLFVSGLGVRAGRPWGAMLAAASAVLSILAGVVFLGAFWYLGRLTGLKDSVARVTFATTNLDLLGELVDGLGLLVFLALYRAGGPRLLARWIEPPTSSSEGRRRV